MRARLFLLAMFLVCLSGMAQTDAVQGVCEYGGRSAVTQGSNSTNKLLGIIPSCTVTVYHTGTTNKATIFKDSSNTPLDNPFTADDLAAVAPGKWLFYAATGIGYDVVMSGGISPLTFPAPVTLTDLKVGSGGSSSGCTVSGSAGYMLLDDGTGHCVDANNADIGVLATDNSPEGMDLEEQGAGGIAIANTDQTGNGILISDGGAGIGIRVNPSFPNGGGLTLGGGTGGFNLNGGSSGNPSIISAGLGGLQVYSQTNLIELHSGSGGDNGYSSIDTGNLASGNTFDMKVPLTSGFLGVLAGSITPGDCPEFDSTGTWLIDSGGSCGGGGTGFPITLGSTAIASGSTTTSLNGLTVNGVVLNAAGSSTTFLNGAGGYTTPAGGSGISFPQTVGGTTTSGGIPYFSSTTVLTSSAALPSGDFVLGGGAGGAPTASFSIVTAAKGGTGIANTATLTLGSSNQNWATLGTGIVKNTTTTGAISDAASADVIGLWTGSCSSSTFLRGDGACATASGSTGISGLTAGYIPQAGSATTITANSHIDDGVTTAGTLTATEPVNINAAGASQVGLTYNSTPIVPGSSTTAVIGPNSSGQEMLSEAGGTAARICDATNGVCSGGGSVTSFSAGTLSPLFTTSVATATTTPALSFTLSTQTANTILAGPSTGSAATPTFRALVSADLPTLPLSLNWTFNSGAAATDASPRFLANHTGTISNCYVLTTASDGSTALTFNIFDNGTTIFSSGAQTIAAATSPGTLTTISGLSITSITNNDKMSINITSGTSNWVFTVACK